MTKKATGKPAALVIFEAFSSELEIFGLRTVYSAACFRGGSSAPESWISATW